jgi:hypothetical protein
MRGPTDNLRRTCESLPTLSEARFPPCPPVVSTAAPAADDRWCTSKEASRYLGITPATLSSWRIKGIGPRYSATLGRDPRYRLFELTAFMEAGLVANTVQAKKKRGKP